MVKGIPAGRIRVGTSSWSDKSLVESDWYPKKTMKAAERIAFYASQFSVVEMENTFRFPPTPAVAQQWVDRTPEGFLLDIDAWSLLTGQPTMAESLWEDLHDEIRPDKRSLRKLYASHLSNEALDQCWKRFVHAVDPLVTNNRLGTIVLRFPRWFSPREENREQLEHIRAYLGDLPAVVEFARPDWLAPQECETTFALLEDLAFGFVCVDAADDDPRGLNKTHATTADVAVVRLLGRRTDSEWTADWRGYRYDDDQLDQICEQVEHLATGAKEVHVLVSTCWRDDAVRNAQALQERF